MVHYVKLTEFQTIDPETCEEIKKIIVDCWEKGKTIDQVEFLVNLELMRLGRNSTLPVVIWSYVDFIKSTLVSINDEEYTMHLLRQT